MNGMLFGAGRDVRLALFLHTSVDVLNPPTHSSLASQPVAHDASAGTRDDGTDVPAAAPPSRIGPRAAGIKSRLGE